jgi:ribonuclease E
MPNKMLIDASHPEETRVVVLRGNRVEEFDFESADKKQLRGNIYLAKVTRVEPSLQAAFVDYGGNRHGFLAFPEIHPDYYQIPVADRQALIEDDARAQRDEDEDEQRPQRRSRRFRHGDRNHRRSDRRRNDDEAREGAVAGDVPATAEGFFAETGARRDDSGADSSDDRAAADDAGPRRHEIAGESDLVAAAQSDGSVEDEDFGPGTTPPFVPVGGLATEAVPDLACAAIRDGSETCDAAPEAESFAAGRADSEGALPFATEGLRAPAADLSERGDAEAAWPEEIRARSTSAEDLGEVEQLGGDAMEEVPVHRHRYRKQYKIQEVIKRRQILLVQVVKEERGNKGAALTTYLSLAGRYSVLMPNTARGGGISRKITDAADRQRLKSIVQELEVPEGMGVILRTAGAARTKAEVKRDFEYLLRMWETVRETTLRSTAPTLVYEEGSLIKRAIRDLYNKDIDEVVVAGEAGYREAKEFMRLLMPSHAKNIQAYREPQPVFAKLGVETQLDAMFSNQVTLKSGGYIVINQTEALVAIDVNSGRSTREHNIEDTALRTNLEAVDEIARQLRLRDLAGLIVLDLIDMEESRNNRTVERRLKEALKNDRARIQVGTISHFGLLEMSRQRIRSGVLEASTVVCPHCAGSGTLRSTASIALHILRVIEDALIKNASYDIAVKAGTTVALYILNQKRAHLRNLETRFGAAISIEADDSLTGPTYYTLERGELASGMVEPSMTAPIEFAPGTGRPAEPRDGQAEEQESEIESEISEALEQSEDRPRVEASRDGETESEGRARRRRRRRRGRGADREVSGIAANAPQPPDDGLGVIARIGGIERAAADEAFPDEAEAEAAPPLEGALPPEPPPAEPPPAEPPPAEAPLLEPGERRRPRRASRARHESVAVSPDSQPEIETVASREAAGPEAETAEVTAAEVTAASAPAARARRGRRTAKARAAEPEATTGLDAEVFAGAPAEDGSSDRTSSAAATETVPPEPTAATREADPTGSMVSADRPKRSGWWQRAKASHRS